MSIVLYMYMYMYMYRYIVHVSPPFTVLSCPFTVMLISQEYFEDIDQIGNGEVLLLAVRESIIELQHFDKNEERFKRVLARLEEAYEVICERVCLVEYM